MTKTGVMKKALLLIVVLFSVGISFGQIKDKFTRAMAIGYANYPTVNHSSIGINWLTFRYNPYEEIRTGKNSWAKIDKHGNVVQQDYDFEISVLPVTWLFPNIIQNSWGTVNVSLVGMRLRFGRGRMKPFIGAELLGRSNRYAMLGEKINGKGGAFVNSASFGVGYYLTQNIVLYVSGGAMVRSFTTDAMGTPSTGNAFEDMHLSHTVYPFLNLSIGWEKHKNTHFIQNETIDY